MALTRADVGRRVVVRALVPGETGPSGAPALTDTLGRLESWDGDALGVRKADGTLVRIPLVDVVAGKPVPPRGSRRTVARLPIGPQDLERICSDGWPAVVSRVLGSWRLRAAGGFTARANSALVAGHPGLPVDRALEAVRAFYAEFRLPALAQVVLESDEERALVDRGWLDPRPGRGGVLVQVASVPAALRRRRPGRGDDVRLTPHMDEGWVGRYTRAAHTDPGLVRAVLEGAGQVRFAQVGTRVGAPPAAIGRAVITGSWVGLAAVEVEPAQRGQGLARAVVESLLSWAAEQGATSAYVQTSAGNDAATGLYSSYGFRTHHRYRYLQPPREVSSSAWPVGVRGR